MVVAEDALSLGLARFISEFGFGELPADIVTLAKQHLLDSLAAGFLGTLVPWPRMIADLVAEQGGHPQASVFGSSARVTASQAALCNGALISAFEAEYSAYLSHTAATATPAALAMGEHLGVDGRSLLRALVLGSEVGCRLGTAQTKAVEEERGFHNPGVNGPLAAAAAVGTLLELDPQTQANAFGIAASHAGGLAEFAWDGAMTKRLHCGRAAQMGLESAQLAARGFTGPTTVIEGKFGWLHAFSPSPKPEMLLDGIGEIWRMEAAETKPYPCKGHSQGIVAVLQELKSQRTIDPRAVRSVGLRTSDPGRTNQARYWNRHPTTMLGAQYSVPFMTALALVRDLDDPRQFNESVLCDDDVRRLAETVTSVAMPGDKGHFEIDLVTDDETITARTGPFVGSPQNPASMQDTERKFRRYSRHVLDCEQQDAVIATVHHLDDLDDIRPFVALIRGVG